MNILTTLHITRCAISRSYTIYLGRPGDGFTLTYECVEDTDWEPLARRQIERVLGRYYG